MVFYIIIGVEASQFGCHKITYNKNETQVCQVIKNLTDDEILGFRQGNLTIAASVDLRNSSLDYIYFISDEGLYRRSCFALELSLPISYKEGFIRPDLSALRQECVKSKAVDTSTEVACTFNTVSPGSYDEDGTKPRHKFSSVMLRVYNDPVKRDKQHTMALEAAQLTPPELTKPQSGESDAIASNVDSYVLRLEKGRKYQITGAPRRFW